MASLLPVKVPVLPNGIHAAWTTKPVCTWW